MTSRLRAIADVQAMVNMLCPFTTGPYWMQYLEKPEHIMKTKLIQPHGPLLRAARERASNLSFKRTTTRAAFQEIFQAHASSWPVKASEADMWADVQEKRFRTMCRHVQQAIVKSKKEFGPPWLEALLNPNAEKKDDQDEGELSTLEETQLENEEGMCEEAAEEELLSEADEEADASSEGPNDTVASGPTSAPGRSGSAASGEDWTYGFERETYTAWRCFGKQKTKQTGELFKPEGAQSFDHMCAKFEDDAIYQIPTLMVSEWQLIQQTLGNKRGKTAIARLWSGSNADGEEFYMCRRADRHPIWVLYGAGETRAKQLVQCRTFEEDPEKATTTELLKKMFIGICQDFIAGKIPQDQLCDIRKQRQLEAGAVLRKRPAAAQQESMEVAAVVLKKLKKAVDAEAPQGRLRVGPQDATYIQIERG